VELLPLPLLQLLLLLLESWAAQMSPDWSHTPCTAWCDLKDNNSSSMIVFGLSQDQPSTPTCAGVK
jgi:hypothetical protein